MDFFVIDTRNKNELGPYSQDDANKMANDLNDFVDRNADIKDKPFMVKSRKTKGRREI